MSASGRTNGSGPAGVLYLIDKMGLRASEAPEALGEACARVLKSPDLRKRLGSAARGRVRRQHDVATIVGRYEDLYEGFLGDAE